VAVMPRMVVYHMVVYHMVVYHMVVYRMVVNLLRMGVVVIRSMSVEVEGLTVDDPVKSVWVGIQSLVESREIAMQMSSYMPVGDKKNSHYYRCSS
jgi:hypothetical protein